MISFSFFCFKSKCCRFYIKLNFVFTVTFLLVEQIFDNNIFSIKFSYREQLNLRKKFIEKLSTQIFKPILPLPLLNGRSLKIVFFYDLWMSRHPSSCVKFDISVGHQEDLDAQNVTLHDQLQLSSLTYVSNFDCKSRQKSQDVIRKNNHPYETLSTLRFMSSVAVIRMLLR